MVPVVAFGSLGIVDVVGAKLSVVDNFKHKLGVTKID
jgi:hypothetical protein